MANIQTRTTEDNRVMYTARIRIKGYPQQTATFSRLTDAKQWAQKTEAKIREGIHFSQAEAKRHTFADMVERYIKTVHTHGTQHGFVGNQHLRDKIDSFLKQLNKIANKNSFCFYIIKIFLIYDFFLDKLLF